jgi:hypothetical protein
VRAEPATAAAESREPHETRAADWVKRFVGNQGPPRIGAALMVAHASDADVEPLCAAAEELPGDAPKKPLKLIVLDDLPDDVPAMPASRRALPTVRHHRGAPRRAIAIAVASVAVCAAGVFAVQRFGDATEWPSRLAALMPARSTDAPTRTTGSPASAPVVQLDPTPAPPSAITLASTSGSRAPVVTPVEPDDATEADAPPPAAPAVHEAKRPAADSVATPARRERLGLEVGTYLDVERARLECDRLASESGLRAWVVTDSEYGAASYRVVLGVFRTRDRAEASATTLLERGLVSEAQVVDLPGRRARH